MKNTRKYGGKENKKMDVIKRKHTKLKPTTTERDNRTDNNLSQIGTVTIVSPGSNSMEHQVQTRRKEKDVIRIFTQNVNGIPINNSEIHFQQMIQVMLEKEVDLFEGSETNLGWNNYSLQHKCYKMIRQHIPGGAWKPTTSRIPMQSNQKHGGNLMGMTKSIRARAQVIEKDSMGRLVWTILQGKQKPIMIIWLYILASTQGLLSTYAQQYQQIQEATGDATPNVYRHYFNDLHTLLEKHQITNKIVMGDYNRTIEDEEVAYLQTQFNLKDIYAENHDGNLNTHQRGSKCIDYILISAELTPYIQNIEYEQFNQGIRSDHRGIYMDLKMEAFTSRKDTYTIGLKSNHGTKVRKYRRKLTKFLETKEILSRIRKLEKVLTWKPKHMKQLIKIDQEITKGMLKAQFRKLAGRY